MSWIDLSTAEAWQCRERVYLNRTVAVLTLSRSVKLISELILHLMAKAREPKRTQSRTAADRKGMVVGYKRVSALDQTDLRQLDGLHTDKLFTDKASGKDTNRPQLTAMLGFVREGDTIVCHTMDRLARNLDDLRKLVLDLVKRGVHVRFVKENLTFTGEDSPMAHLLLSVIGAVAQFERDLIRERQREGIALAKQRKVYLGRVRSLSPAQADDLRRRIEAGEKKALLAREFGISRTTVYEYLGREASDVGARHSSELKRAVKQ